MFSFLKVNRLHSNIDSNIDNSYILYFSDYFPSHTHGARGKGAEYPEDIYKKNDFSQVSKNFRICIYLYISECI